MGRWESLRPGPAGLQCPRNETPLPVIFMGTSCTSALFPQSPIRSASELRNSKVSAPSSWKMLILHDVYNISPSMTGSSVSTGLTPWGSSSMLLTLQLLTLQPWMEHFIWGKRGETRQYSQVGNARCPPESKSMKTTPFPSFMLKFRGEQLHKSVSSSSPPKQTRLSVSFRRSMKPPSSANE